VRGSPFLRSLLALALLLAAAPLVWRITHGREASTTAVAEAGPQTKSIRLQVTFTQLPLSFRVLHLGKEVWSATSRTPEIEQNLSIPYPPEGVDLEFELAWPERTVCAMRVQLTDPDGQEYERTIWGEGKTSEVLTFP
jgi:hypothetical protein